MAGEYIIPIRGRPAIGTADAVGHLEVSSGSRLRYNPGRAGDNPLAAVRIGTQGRYTRAGLYLPQTPITTGRTLYAEPADYSILSYQTNIKVTQTWLNSNATPGTGEWAGWWIVDGVNGKAVFGSNLTPANRNALWVTLADTPILFRNGTFWGGYAGSTSGGIAGGVSNCIVEFEDCTFVGQNLDLLDGQTNGCVRFEGYRRNVARNCNFVFTGFKPKNWTGSNTNPLHGMQLIACEFHNINGRRRDRSTASGWKEAEVVNADFVRENAHQLDTTVGIAGARVQWCRVTNDPGITETEDVMNNYQSEGLADDWILWEHLLIDGAYPMFPNQNYNGGGLMFGDGRGRYQRGQNNIVLNTSNYAFAISGGNDMEHRASVGLGRNRRESDGVRWDKFPDTGIYIRDYYDTDTNGGLFPATRQMNDLLIGWMAGNSDGTYRRNDGVSSISASQGVGSGLIRYVPPGGTTSSDVPLAVLDFYRQQWAQDAEDAGVQVGRRNPVA